VEEVVPQLGQGAEAKHLDVFFGRRFASGLRVSDLNVGFRVFVVACETVIKLQMLPLEVVRQMVSDGVDSLDIPERVFGEQPRGIQNTGFDGEGIRSVIVENVPRPFEALADDLVEDKLDQEMALDDQAEFIAVMS